MSDRPHGKAEGIRHQRPLAARIGLFEEVARLRETRSYPYSRIIEEVEKSAGETLSKSTISEWVRRRHNPLGRTRRFDGKPSPELAYIIGVVAGDGSLNVRKNTYRVRLQAIDLDFVKEFERCLRCVLKTPPHNIWRGARRREYHVDVASFQLHQFLRTKAADLKEYVEHDEECVSAFLRGFFDSEGCVSAQGTLIVSNTDVDLLSYVQRLLGESTISSTGPHRSVPKGTEIVRRGRHYFRNYDCYYLYVRRKSLRAYLERVGFTIGRKQRRLTRAVGNRPI
jgi:intein-encoded DNA endonuclease-like protein